MPKCQLIITGGGTSGHVHPAAAVVRALDQDGFDLQSVAWIGGADKPEAKAAADFNLAFHPISTGKLRRYFSWENFQDIGRVIKGSWQSWQLLKQLEPKLVFATGGYVTVPVVLAAKLRKIPIIAYESDSRLGIANRLAFRFASVRCTGYAEINNDGKQESLPTVHTGVPIRAELLGKPAILPDFLDKNDKPVLFLLGGSQGAKFINEFVNEYGEKLSRDFFIIHQHGPNHSPALIRENYRGYSFIGKELPHFYQAADIIVTRAGSVISEIAAFSKPCIVIPIPSSANNHQYYNARQLEAKQAAIMVQQSSGSEYLYKKIIFLQDNTSLKVLLARNISDFYVPDAAKRIAKLIQEKL